jgi:hypothetical protein
LVLKPKPATDFNPAKTIVPQKVVQMQRNSQNVRKTTAQTWDPLKMKAILVLAIFVEMFARKVNALILRPIHYV